MGAVIVAGRYVPRPPDDQIVNIPSRKVPAVLPTAGGNFPFVPKFWKFDHQDPDPGWVVESVPVAKVQALVGGGYPFVPNRWRYDLQDPNPGWVVESFATGPVQKLVGGNYPFKPNFWQQNFDDSSVWSGSPQNVNRIIDTEPAASTLLVVAGRYVPNPPDDTFWNGKSTPVSVLSFPVAAVQTPFIPTRWAYDLNTDGEPKWIGSPSDATWTLSTTLQLYAPSATRFIPDGVYSEWSGNPQQVNNLLLAVQVNPFLPSRWKFDYNDAPVWNGKPSNIPGAFMPVGGGYPFIPVRWRFNNDDPGTWRGAPVNVSIIQQLVIATPLVPQRWKFDHDQPPFWAGSPVNVPITITNPLPPVPPAPKGVGWIGKPTKRWWEELEEEYRERYAQDHPPSPAKKAVAARKKVKAEVTEAISHGLLSPEKAPDLIELAVKTYTAPKLDQALYYAKEALEYIDRLREEDEEDIMLMIWGMQ